MKSNEAKSKTQNLSKINELILQNAIKRFFTNDNSEIRYFEKQTFLNDDDLTEKFNILVYSNLSNNKNNSENTKQFVTQNGKSLTILSIGEHNRLAGPDFKNSCLLIDGNLKIGDIEFHKKSSQWISHKHYQNPEYSNVILHIIFSEDALIHNNFSANFETLVLEQNQLIEYLNPKIKYFNYDFSSYDEFLKYALFRFLRRSFEISNLLKNNTNTFNKSFEIFASNYLNRFFSLQKRSIKNLNFSIDEIIEKIIESSFYNSIFSLNNENINNFFDDYIKSENLNFGEHLKLELLTNVILPFSFCVAKNKVKTAILLYYLTKKSKEKYGILQRKFPQIQQEFIWQQQGMLEYLKESGNLHSKNQSQYKNSDYLINYDFSNYFSVFFNFLLMNQ